MLILIIRLIFIQRLVLWTYYAQGRLGTRMHPSAPHRSYKVVAELRIQLQAIHHHCILCHPPQSVTISEY